MTQFIGSIFAFFDALFRLLNHDQICEQGTMKKFTPPPPKVCVIKSSADGQALANVPCLTIPGYSLDNTL